MTSPPPQDPPSATGPGPARRGQARGAISRAARLLSTSSLPIETVRNSAAGQSRAALGNLLATLLLFIVLDGTIESGALIAATAAAVAAALYRACLVPAIFGHITPGRRARHWGRRMTLAALAVGLAYAPFPWLPGLHADPVRFIFVVAILFGICGSAAVTLTNHTVAFITLSYPILGSCIVAALQVGHPATTGTAFACVIFLSYVTRTLWRNAYALAELRRLNHAHVLLSAEARRRSDALAAANVSLTSALQELRSAQSQLVQQEKLASLGSLVAGVAHEINTPLGVAVTVASHLETEQSELRAAFADGKLRREQLSGYLERSAEAVHILRRNLARAAELISSFKRVAVGRTHDSPQEVDLSVFLQDLVRSLDPMLRKANVEVRLTFDGDRRIKTLPGSLSQVITNLMQNAVIHAFDGIAHPIVSVHLAAADPDQPVVLEVSDNGVGMDASTAARAFEPFFTTRRGAGGTGLGLNIVHNLVTGPLRSELELLSAPGEGTRFRIGLGDLGDAKARDVLG